MRILGIDTSLTATGLARIDIIENDDGPVMKYRADISCITLGAPKPTKDKSKRALARRVNVLIDRIEECFIEVDAVGMEGLAFGARGESAWVLPWVFGRVIELCERHDVPLQIVATSARAKYAAGKGNADKDTVMLATARQFPEAEVTNNNEADALIVGAVVAHQRGMPIAPVTQYRLDVVAGLGN